jgi:hypothetical protein
MSFLVSFPCLFSRPFFTTTQKLSREAQQKCIFFYTSDEENQHSLSGDDVVHDELGCWRLGAKNNILLSQKKIGDYG